MFEGRPVLSLENVLWHDVDADIVFVGHKEKKPWRRDLEIDHHGVRIARCRVFHGLLHIHAPAHFGTEVAQGVERIGDVLGAERRAVAPGDAGTGLDGQAFEIGCELVALGEPHICLVGKGTVVGKRLIDEVGTVLVVGADRIRVPQIPVDPAALAAAPNQHYRAVARDRRGGGARAVPRQDRTDACQNAGLDHVAPAGMGRAGMGRRETIGHLSALSSPGHRGFWVEGIAQRENAGCQETFARRWAARIARQTRSGVAGMSMWSMPSGASASTIALMIVCGAAMQPAWPEPLTPSGLAEVGSSASVMSNDGRSPARGSA